MDNQTDAATATLGQLTPTNQAGESVAPTEWHASLELRLQQNGQGTRLSRCRHQGPLYVQKPFYPEGRDHAHVYLLHPPGGLVSGDWLQISVELQNEAGALLTTPGAARMYRARADQTLQRQSTQMTVAEQASLEWFPLETIVFNGACVELETRVELADNSHFVAWEITCFGLPASDEPFVSGKFCQHYQVNHKGRPVFVDRLVLDANREAFLQGSAAMQQKTVSGFFLLGPFANDPSVNHSEYLEQLREAVIAQEVETVAGISKVDDWYIGRYLGDSAEQARTVFSAWWQILRPILLQRPACAPRIWLT